MVNLRWYSVRTPSFSVQTVTMIIALIPFNCETQPLLICGSFGVLHHVYENSVHCLTMRQLGRAIHLD